MKNREFLQLAKPHTKQFVGGSLYSEKLDGMRCVWDGGMTRGTPIEEVPFANLTRGGHGKIATGLWSRYGNPIFAPDYFLDSLPNFTLDGELWLRRGAFQETMSIVKDHIPGPGWKDIKYMVFDAIPIETLFQVGRINDPNYQIIIQPGITNWAIATYKRRNCKLVVERPFISQLKFLNLYLNQNHHVKLLEQNELPQNEFEAKNILFAKLEEYIALGAEGLIVRNRASYWQPKRCDEMLKVKKRLDDEAIVIGYIAAEVGKIHGKLGSLIVRYNHTEFNLSGFTDEEREFADTHSVLWAYSNPGRTAPPQVKSKHFPIGSKVTFSYSELSNDGTPCKAAYLRKRVD